VECQKAINERAHDAADQQAPVIHHRFFATDAYGYRILTGLSIGFDVADVVDVEDADGKQSAAQRGKYLLPGNGFREEVIRSHHTYQPEKDQHGEVAKADVTVRTFPYRVGNGGYDAQHPQTKKEQQSSPVHAKRYQEQGDSTSKAQDHKDDHRRFHLL